MIGMITTPHLPSSKVKHIIIGKKYRNLLETAIFEHDLYPIWLDDDPYVDERLSGHVDLSVVQISNTLYMAKYLSDCELNNEVKRLGFDVRYCNDPGKDYPEDAGLNFCIIGKRLIYNPKTAISITNIDYNCISVRQGYTKCSVCIVDEQSIITSDRMIAEALLNDGMNVLYISKPFVKLEGYAYGFIGGASFKISQDELAFTGVIKDAEIRKLIEDFLHERNIRPIYLTENEIFDIGSAIPLTEELSKG